jgi:proline racemase
MSNAGKVLLFMRSSDGRYVTSLAIKEWKGHPAVAEAAVLTVGYLQHRIFDRSPLDTGEYLGMAHFAAVPDGMLLVGEDNVRHP